MQLDAQGLSLGLGSGLERASGRKHETLFTESARYDRKLGRANGASEEHAAAYGAKRITCAKSSLSSRSGSVGVVLL